MLIPPIARFPLLANQEFCDFLEPPARAASSLEPMAAAKHPKTQHQRAQLYGRLPSLDCVEALVIDIEIQNTIIRKAPAMLGDVKTTSHLSTSECPTHQNDRVGASR